MTRHRQQIRPLAKWVIAFLAAQASALYADDPGRAERQSLWQEQQVVDVDPYVGPLAGPGAPRSGSRATANRTPRYQMSRVAPSRQAPASGRVGLDGQDRLVEPGRGEMPDVIGSSFEQSEEMPTRNTRFRRGETRSVMRSARANGPAMDAAGPPIMGETMLAEPEILPSPEMGVEGPVWEEGAEVGGRQMDCHGRNCGRRYCRTCFDCEVCEDWYFGQDLTAFAGVHGFKGPVDRGENGNFGFQEGVNWSSPFWNAEGVGFQLGAQAVQSNLNDTVAFQDTRSQGFITGGLFRRQMSGSGWQWGVVYDHLADNFDQSFDVGQIRGELSYFYRGHEFGFWFASGSRDFTPATVGTNGILSYEPIDQYSLFYRRRLASGGEARLWGGATSNSGGIFGGDIRVPLSSEWALTSNFNYLIPQSNNEDGITQESWNLGINLVWYVCPNGAFRAGQSRYRPLFDVADNGTFMVDVVRE